MLQTCFGFDILGREKSFGMTQAEPPLLLVIHAHHGVASQGSLGSVCWFLIVVLKCGSLWSLSGLHIGVSLSEKHCKFASSTIQ